VSANPNIKVDPAQTSATTFRAEDGTDPNFFIAGRLTGGVLTFVVVAELPDGRHGNVRGTEYFDAMIDHFGVGNIQQIMGVWGTLFGLDANLMEFNQNTTPGANQLPDDEAATETWTGRRARDKGLTKATVVFKDPTNAPGK